MVTVPRVIYKGSPKRHSWARWMVHKTMRKNDNNLIAVIGKTGSGKTWSAMSICEIMAKIDGAPFKVEHIVFSLGELMKLINSGTLKRGSKIIFDEPQASISARDFQSMANKVFNLLVSTFRHLNLSLFFCTPFESLLDKSTRKLLHARFETMGINSKKKTCRLKPRYIEYSDWKAAPYLKQLIVSYKDGEGNPRGDKLFHWDVPMPSQDLIEKYERKKRAFTTNLNKNISQQLERFDEAGKSITAQYKAIPEAERKPLTTRQREVMEVIANHSFKEAEKILGIDKASISQNKTLALKKGYKLEEFKTNTPHIGQNP